jgi:Cof subfamily protein (haloacid dehalogenase superfamily)
VENKIFVSDLDGTLLDMENGLSEYALNILNTLIDQGLDLVIATGRDMENTIKALAGLKITNLTVLTNGAILADLNTRDYKLVHRIQKSISKEIMNFASQYHLIPIVFAVFEPSDNSITFLKGKWSSKGVQPLSLQSYSDLIEKEVISIQFCDVAEKIEPMYQLLQDRYQNRINLIKIKDVNLEGYYWLEINSELAGKEKMIDTYLKMRRIEWSSVIALGDQSNDLEFLKKARYSICPENADPVLFDYVDEIVPSAKKGGIIAAIQRLFTQN